MLLGELLAFQLAFDASDDIMNSALLAEGANLFDNSSNPALAARAGIGEDLQVIAPADPTTTISGWTGFDGDTTTAAREHLRRLRRHMHGKGTAPFAPPRRLAEDDLKALASLKTEARGHLHGSNNWVVGPQLSATGNVMVANDTHLSIDSPATFWIQHLVNHGSDQPLNVMGEQLPGVPLVTLGMNRHVAWGATVNYIDVTDVYQETIVSCLNDAGPCAQFNGQLVPLVPTVQTFQLGYIGVVGSTLTLTTYSVPEHGPIIPRLLTDASGNVTGLDALRPQELSIRYTGYTAAPLLKAIFGLDTAGSFQDAKAALDQNFGYGGQNWVVGDDQGNFGWTETIEVPLRPPSTTNLPWQVLPGDGSAEWGAAWMDPHYIPHAINPPKGFIATSNNDPIGATLNDSPFVGQPMDADGGQLYLGTYYDPGTRVGRSTRRIEAFADAGQKLTIDDMQSIQADAITEWGQGFAPTFLNSANALLLEAAALADAGLTSVGDAGGSADAGLDAGFGPYPELASLLLTAESAPAGGFSVALLQQAQSLVAGWTFDTPSGVTEDSPTAQQLSDSKAEVVMAYWTSHFAHDTLDDELAIFDSMQVGLNELQEEKLMLFLVQDPLPSFLKTGLSPVTGDFDPLRQLEQPRRRRIEADDRRAGAGRGHRRNHETSRRRSHSMGLGRRPHHHAAFFPGSRHRRQLECSCARGPHLPERLPATWRQRHRRRGTPWTGRGRLRLRGSRPRDPLRGRARSSQRPHRPQRVARRGDLRPGLAALQRPDAAVAQESDLRLRLPGCGGHRRRPAGVSDQRNRADPFPALTQASEAARAFTRESRSVSPAT